MIRLLSTTLLVAGLASPASHDGAALPAAQPQPQKTTTTQVYTVAQGSQSYLGVDIRDVDKDRMAALKLKEERGTEVTMVDQDAPAGKAGIKEHDVIMEFNSAPVESEEQLRRLIRETPPGRTVTLGISRDGNPTTVSVQLAERSKVATEALPRVSLAPRMPDLPDLPNRMDIPAFALYSTSLGMQTESLTRQLGDFFGVKNGEGVLVRNVEKGSAAEKAGIKAGDVIVRVGNERLSDRSDLARILRKHREGGKLSVGIVRDKKEQTLTINVPQRGSKDSSLLNIEVEDLQSELAGLETLAPEIAAGSAFAATESLKEWADSMDTYKDSMSDFGKNMRDYKDELKELNDQLKSLEKQFKEQQKTFDKGFHFML